MEKTATIILVNHEGELLLQLRDDDPEIALPNHWTTFGGFVEEGETAEECIKREMKEELELAIEDPELITRHETCREQDEYVFLAYVDMEGEVDVNEGQKGKFYTREDAKKLDNLACDALEAIETYEEFIREGPSSP